MTNTNNSPTAADLKNEGHSDEQIKSILSAGRYAALIGGCELPGEAATCRADLTGDWA